MFTKDSPRPRIPRGFTLIETLVAALVIALCVAALITIWTASLTQIEQSRRFEVASQLVRHDLENAKAQGFWNLPLGTMTNVGGHSVGQWVGPIQYYDVRGQLLDSSAPIEGRCFVMQRVITDYGVAQDKNSTLYTLLFDSTRTVRTVARSVKSNEIQAEMGTCIVRGGL